MAHRHSENKEKKCLTSNLGVPIYDDQNSLTIGINGPGLIEDQNLIDKLAQFDRERIPERVVHAKGAGAHGYFECYKSMKEFTCASFLSEAKKKTPVFVRFSTVIGGRGSADTVRDPRGFAVKFYTDEGNYDIVGNDLPVFFIRDAIKFPDVIHSLKPAPDSNLKDVSRFWDFVANSPEATHMIVWLYSDLGIVKSFRHMDGFGVNTYIWVNAKGDRKYIKYHWKTQQGVQKVSRKEGEILAGLEPDIAVKDLHDAIECGKYPKYELLVQMMDIDVANTLDFDPLDDTKTWPEDKFPLMKVGMMTLDRNPDNFFAEVEQSAFCPSNIIRGVELSADKMLQGRSFSYKDTQRYRIGTNFMQLPINKPKVPVNNNLQDGTMTYEIKKGSINYKPNSLNCNEPLEYEKPKYKGMYYEGNIVSEEIEKTNNFKQAGERYRILSSKDKDALIDNIASELWEVPKEIADRVICYFTYADEEFGKRVKMAIEQN